MIVVVSDEKVAEATRQLIAWARMADEAGFEEMAPGLEKTLDIFISSGIVPADLKERLSAQMQAQVTEEEKKALEDFFK